MTRVLVVEDDARINHVFSRFLRKRGFDVHGVQTAREALTWAEGQSPFVALVDVVLPESSGVELVIELRAKGRELPVLFMSGYPPERVAQLSAMLNERTQFLSKPCSLKELLERLLQLAPFVDADERAP